MAKKLLNEYDQTKKMLNTLRNFKSPSKPSLTERRHYYNEQDDPSAEASAGEDDDLYKNDREYHNDEGIDVVNDVDVKLLSSDPNDKTLTDEQKTMLSGIIDSFREQVSQTAELDPGFTFNEDGIRLDGNIPEFDLKFTYIAGQNVGLYINAQMLNITDQTMQVLTKLSTFNKQITDSLDLMLRQRKNN